MENLKLIGDRFICNIAQPENSPGGLFVVNRDPRKQRIKPDAYVGVVEKVGPDCRLVKEGQKVVVRRWVYSQHDVDDERIVARERQILMLDDETPYPGVVAMKVSDDLPKTNLVIPDTVKAQKRRSQSYSGRVIASGCFDYKKNDLLWVERRDSGQFFLGKDILVFKNEPDRMNGDFPVLAIEDKEPTLEVV